MNSAPSRLRSLRLLLWGLVLVAALGVGVALALHWGAGTATRADGRGPPQGGSFTLTDQDGRRVRDTDFAGKYRLIYFGYAYCPDVCPVDLQQIAAAHRLLRERKPALAAKLQPIFITVDPARDTPATLKQFVSAFPGVIGLTGSGAEIAQALKTFGIQGYGSFARKVPQQGGGRNDYLMDHTRFKMLYGPDGRGIAFLSEQGNAEQLAAELEADLQ